MPARVQTTASQAQNRSVPAPPQVLRDCVKGDGNLYVPPGICEQTDVVKDAAASNSEISEDCIKHEGKNHEAIRAPSEVTMLMVRDGVLSKPLIVVEYCRDAPTTDDDRSPQAQLKIRSAPRIGRITRG
jgi:hypothetical protein